MDQNQAKSEQGTDAREAERLAGLERIALALSGAASVDDVADLIITEGLAALGGNSGAVALYSADRATLHTVRCVGYPPDLVARFRCYGSETSLPTADAARSASPIFIETARERLERYPHLAANVPMARGALAALPLVVHGVSRGGITLGFANDRTFTQQDRAFLRTVGQICAQALDRARLYDAAQVAIAEREQLLARQREFMRDVLLSVTGGKLRLCQDASELPATLPIVGEPVTIGGMDGCGISTMRKRAEAAAADLNYAPERNQDLVAAVSECAMNAAVHANGGVGTIHSNGVDRVQVWVVDQGGGITFEALPAATLRWGYTTSDTMGHGFKVMLKTADRVYLLTGLSGTTVVLEQDKEQSLWEWAVLP